MRSSFYSIATLTLRTLQHQATLSCGFCIHMHNSNFVFIIRWNSFRILRSHKNCFIWWRQIIPGVNQPICWLEQNHWHTLSQHAQGDPDLLKVLLDFDSFNSSFFSRGRNVASFPCGYCVWTIPEKPADPRCRLWALGILVKFSPRLGSICPLLVYLFLRPSR